MVSLGAIGFTTPWLLLGLVALPVLWFLLRAVPPAPMRRRFPGVALLLGLTDEETQTDRTPWWLLVLRMAAIAALIVGFAGPVLNPRADPGGSGPLLVLLDGTWADARDWPRRIERLETLLDEAGRGGRPIAVATTTDLPEGAPAFQAAGAWANRLPDLAPVPWAPAPQALADWAGGLTGAFDTVWICDGLAHEGRAPALAALENRGSVRVIESGAPLRGLRPARFEEGNVALTVLRAEPGPEREVRVAAHGRDPGGVERRLARGTAIFAAGATEATLTLSLPPELRNRVTRFSIQGESSAGAVSLTDDSLKRREIALIAGEENREGIEILSPLHFLEQALAPTADLVDGALSDILLANPDVIVLADVATLAPAEAEGLQEWVEGGGLLLRFAGPRLAASDVSRQTESPLMPVRLRAGGRSVGGAMSWGEPKSPRPFGPDSPFHGLAIPDEVQVNAQVLARPDPDLAQRSIAALEDGTPLVTRKGLGDGRVVLFHVTANAEWSNLPLSGLFVAMLERLAVSTRPAEPEAADLAGTTWVPEARLDAFGRVLEAGDQAGVPGERLAGGRIGPDMPPGVYAGDERRIARNVLAPETTLAPAEWPARVPVAGLAVAAETGLKGALLTMALLLLATDALASLWLSGRLRGQRATAAAMVLLALMLAAPPQARAQGQGEGRERTSASGSETAAGPEGLNDAEVERALAATTEVVLAHVRTGEPEVDRVAHAGLRGLSDVLYRRTSVEPAAPIAVNLETDALAFYPLLYWPVTADQPLPSDRAYAKLNEYLRTGGMIVFDTRDANVTSAGGTSPAGDTLQRLAAPLDVPPLEPVPDDHVLTRTFYLLQNFPGRYSSGTTWVEAAPADASQAEGVPFRDLNDNVTPVLIGANDWAGAWATDETGQPLYPVGGSGYGGQRQREIAYRFGVNLVMHVLTGNYKSDQVHVPALLDRLGQ